MDEQHEQYGVFVCPACQDERVAEIPPMWFEDGWHVCCDEPVELHRVLIPAGN
jgi:hypothetical protein